VASLCGSLSAATRVGDKHGAQSGGGERGEMGEIGEISEIASISRLPLGRGGATGGRPRLATSETSARRVGAAVVVSGEQSNSAQRRESDCAQTGRKSERAGKSRKKQEKAGKSRKNGPFQWIRVGRRYLIARKAAHSIRALVTHAALSAPQPLCNCAWNWNCESQSNATRPMRALGSSWPLPAHCSGSRAAQTSTWPAGTAAPPPPRALSSLMGRLLPERPPDKFGRPSACAALTGATLEILSFRRGPPTRTIKFGQIWNQTGNSEAKEEEEGLSCVELEPSWPSGQSEASE